MKQITKTDSIRARLRKALGPDVDLEGLKVYEAIALNTRPLRKNHPLYNGSRAERSLLLEMAAALEAESRPIQIQHDNGPLPIGRAFHGEVVDKGNESELRVLFFLDATAETEAQKIDGGSVDQVSVSILPKQILSSASGFDFLGEKSTFEQRWTGTDPDGNTLGKKGVFGRLIGLDKWFELSLVGLGGAENARIVNREQSHFGASYGRLAANGMDPSVLVLEATVGTDNMDLTALVAAMNDSTAKLTLADAKVVSLTADIATLNAACTTKDARIVDLEAQLAALGEPATALIASQAEVSSVTADRDAAVVALKEVAQKVLTASGKVSEAVPETVAELASVINDTAVGLVAALAGAGKAKDAVDDAKKSPVAALSGFRVRK